MSRSHASNAAISLRMQIITVTATQNYHWLSYCSMLDYKDFYVSSHFHKDGYKRGFTACTRSPLIDLQ